MSTIQRAYKTELDLNNAQITACKQDAGAARWAYNWGLQRKQDAYPTFRTPIRHFWELSTSRETPGSITVCSSRRLTFLAHPVLGTWGTSVAILGGSAENRCCV